MSQDQNQQSNNTANLLSKELGLCLEVLSSMGIDIEALTEGLHKRISLGDSKALFILGCLQALGALGLSKDPAKALESFQKAADQGSPDAQHMLATAYLEGDNQLLMVEADADKGIKYLKQAAKAGHKDAELQLARITGAQGDHKQSFKMLSRLAKKGNPQAQLELGMCYLSGEGTKANAVLGMDYATRAAKAGSAEAQLFVATQYLGGYYVKRNPKQYLYWVEIGAKDNPMFQTLLGLSYLAGALVEQDIEKGMQSLLKATDKNIFECLQLIDFSTTLKPDDGGCPADVLITNLSNYAMGGVVEAKCLLGVIFAQGNIVPKDTTMAKDLLMEAVNDKCDKARQLLEELKL